MAAPTNYVFVAGNAKFCQAETFPNADVNYGNLVTLEDECHNFVFLTRALGGHGQYIFGSGFVVSGENGEYLATAAHKYYIFFAVISIRQGLF